MIKKLVVLDDEEGFKYLFEHHFDDLITNGDLELSFCINSKSAEKTITVNSADTALLCDVLLDQENGLIFAREMKSKFPKVKILIMSGLDCNQEEFPFFSKPLDYGAMRTELFKT